MRYILPSSKIVFTDFMILLVCVLMGLNSVMSFSEEHKEKRLPPVSLPPTSGVKHTGATATNSVSITIRSGKNGKIYFYNNKEVALWELMDLIQKAKVPAVVLRGDQKAIFEWEELCRLTARFMKAGVKEISYATTTEGEIRP